MKKGMLPLLLVCLTVILAGCQRKGNLVTKEEESIVLTVLAGQSTADAGVEDMITKSVAKEFPDVKLEWECVDWGESFDAQMRARFSAGDVPDIMIGKAQDVHVYAKTGKLAPLTKLHTQKVKEEALQTVLMDDVPYGLPYNAWYQGVIYNKELFQRFNLQVPESKGQLEDVIECLKANDVTPFASHFQENWAVGNTTMQFFMNEIFPASPYWGDDFRNRKVSYARSDKIRYCMENNKKILENSWEDALSIDQFEADNRFTKQEAAMYLTGSWSLQFANQYSKSQEFGIFPYPNEEGNASLIRETNMTFMKSADTKYEELVDEIFNFLLEDSELIEEILDYTQTVSVMEGVESSYRSCIQNDIDYYTDKGRVIDVTLGNTQLIWTFQNRVAEQQLLWIRGQKNLDEVLTFADEHRDESGPGVV